MEGSNVSSVERDLHFSFFSNISCTQKVIALEKNIATSKSFLFKKKKKKKISARDVYHASESINFQDFCTSFLR